MNINSIIVTIVIYTLLVVQASYAKQDAFKINRLNLIWSKAQHSLGPNKLKDLKNDLIRHERDEIKAKKAKAHGQDKSGAIETTVRKRLLEIMEKYGLLRYYDDIHPNGNDDASRTKPSKNNLKHSPSPKFKAFRDSKLDKLWKKAEKSGFSQEELMLLHEEFESHQKKLDNHYDHMHSIDDDLDAISNDERNLNSLEDDPAPKKKDRRHLGPIETPSEKKARLSANTQQSLRDKHSEIKREYKQLKSKVIEGRPNDASLFEEPAVNNMWAAAQKANLTGEELEVFKEELEHFEQRVKKLKHFQNELERNNLSPGEPIPEDDVETKHIKKRVRDLTSKIDKLHKTLVKRLNLIRDEL